MSAASTLSSRRLDLPAIRRTHLSFLLQGMRDAAWADDFPQATDVDNARHLLEGGLVHDDGVAPGMWLVVERGAGKVIGTVGFDAPPHDGVVDVFYGIVPSRRREGFAVEALECLTAHALTQPGITSVEGYAQSEESAAVLLKAGYQAVGWSGLCPVFRQDGSGLAAAN